MAGRWVAPRPITPPAKDYGILQRILLATVAVFVAWEVLDFVTHGLILREA